MSGVQALGGTITAKRAAFRIGLAVALVLTVLASIRAVQTPEDDVVQAAHGVTQRTSGTSNASPVQRLASAAASTVAAKPLLAIARGDPFYPAPPPVPVTKAPPRPAPVVAAAPPPPPAPPPFSYQFFGRMRGPDGQTTVYLSNQDRLIPIAEGTELEGGYRVETIGASEILIKHGASGQEVRVTLQTPS
jgi:hypothetical protein